MLRLILLGTAALAAPLLALALLAAPSFAQEVAAASAVAATNAATATGGVAATGGVTPGRLSRDPAVRRAQLLAMDTDHDGRWSKAEWLAGGRRAHSFDLMDTDNNGYLTPEELRAGMARMREMRDAKPE